MQFPRSLLVVPQHRQCKESLIIAGEPSNVMCASACCMHHAKTTAVTLQPRVNSAGHMSTWPWHTQKGTGCLSTGPWNTQNWTGRLSTCPTCPNHKRWLSTGRQKSGAEDSREAGEACIIVGRVGFCHARRASTTVGGLRKSVRAVCQEQPAQTQENVFPDLLAYMHACKWEDVKVGIFALFHRGSARGPLKHMLTAPDLKVHLLRASQANPSQTSLENGLATKLPEAFRHRHILIGMQALVTPGISLFSNFVHLRADLSLWVSLCL